MDFKLNIIAILLSIFLLACNDDIKDRSLKYTGIYIGEMHKHLSYYDPMIGRVFEDTSYQDSITVTSINFDSISITVNYNSPSNYIFELNDTNVFRKLIGSKNITYFTFLPEDTLDFYHLHYGGNGLTGTSVSYKFIGIRD